MSRSFPLARMDATIAAFTALALSLPVVFLAVSFAGGPVRYVMIATAAALVAMYVGVWVFTRPTRFEVGDAGLVVVFPAWRRVVPRAAIRGVEKYPGNRFGREIGWGLRVGVGGLWGGFGWLVTRQGTLEMAISRVKDLVVVRCEGRRDLLLSPGDVDGFAAAIEDLLAHAA